METNDEKKARVTFEQPEKECPICNGSGEVQQTDVDWDDCRRCNGTGKVQPEAAGQEQEDNEYLERVLFVSLAQRDCTTDEGLDKAVEETFLNLKDKFTITRKP